MRTGWARRHLHPIARAAWIVMVAGTLAATTTIGAAPGAGAQTDPDGGARLVGVVPFAKNQVGLDADGQAALDAMLPALDGARAVRLDGYVQRARSPKPAPTGLSRKRAEAVQKYLDRQFAKQRWSITTTVRGMGQPATDPGAPGARRVEVWITS